MFPDPVPHPQPKGPVCPGLPCASRASALPAVTAEGPSLLTAATLSLHKAQGEQGQLPARSPCHPTGPQMAPLRPSDGTTAGKGSPGPPAACSGAQRGGGGSGSGGPSETRGEQEWGLWQGTMNCHEPGCCCGFKGHGASRGPGVGQGHGKGREGGKRGMGAVSRDGDKTEVGQR